MQCQKELKKKNHCWPVLLEKNFLPLGKQLKSICPCIKFRATYTMARVAEAAA